MLRGNKELAQSHQVKGVRDQNHSGIAEKYPRPPSTGADSSPSRLLVCKRLAGARGQWDHEQLRIPRIPLGGGRRVHKLG